MSEITTISKDDYAGDIAISRDGDGYIELNQDVDVILVATKNAPAVALALLGGITEEMLNRVGFVLAEDYGECSGQTARRVLDAVFGLNKSR